ncbi:MAG: hypothetical protein Q8P18_33380 [Pseudomonadota bacterium]|nr:hypothetical protein [Pseudomonadota bacterium]
MDVCAACGIVAPRPGLPCEACGGAEIERAPAPRGPLYFVQVRCQFQCRGCGRLAPLDAVETGGLARCASCALTQAVDPGGWQEGLAFAHAVGDLASAGGASGDGLHPNARWAIGDRNPHRRIGVEQASDTLILDGTRRMDGMEVRRTLRLRAAPGHPLCEGCHAPLQIDLAAEGQARTRCPGCGTTARYDVSAGVLAACHGLRGVLADAQREDLSDARTAEDGGVVALSCPGCGAPLRVEGHSHTAACPFCHLVCRIPSAAPSASAADVPPTPFWLLFGGPSARRQQLERPFEDGAGAITQPVPVSAATGLRRWLGLLPTVVVAGGMTIGTGVVLFVLMRMGLVVL